MKYHVVVCALLQLQGIAVVLAGHDGPLQLQETVFVEEEGTTNDPRQLTGSLQTCFGTCRSKGIQKRKECFKYCNLEHPFDGANGDNWQKNRVKCKNVCRDIYRSKINSCKAGCRIGGAYFNETEKEWCSVCPCCVEGSPFMETLRDPDVCDEYSGGDRTGTESAIILYRCEVQSPIIKYHTSATLLTEGDRFAVRHTCQENANDEVLTYCFEEGNRGDYCQEGESMGNEMFPISTEAEACQNLMLSIRTRKFLDGDKCGGAVNLVESVDEYCKHVLMV